ncbi:MAG TPA: hypothetical protein VK747_23220 [Blastocatellia bacterium]|nr:hypothetical protein [Blastocatellia bacterium]
MLNRPVRQTIAAFIASLALRTKYLLGLWVFFLVLVAFGIHGSSTGVTAGWWAPEKPYTGYLFNPTQNLSSAGHGGLQELLMAKARGIRWDELLITTPLALSQLSHNPRFPVVNTNIGNGQNMLISPHVPVWHVATLARPATWGYFFLGAQRGLAWYWWFRVFSCFTVLYLLFEVILKGNRRLAAFGGFWYCASAYVVCWSLWPAQLVFFGALGCLAAYHLLASAKVATQIISGVLLGLSIPGFVMFVYPPWQVSVAYLFLFIFAGLLIRDKLYLSFKPISKYRLLSLAVALLLAGGLTLSFLLTCLPDLKVMSNTVYPGRRVSAGGDYSFAMLFKGMYNLVTIYTVQPKMGNESEASSFYYFFPAVFLAILLSKRLWTNLGILGWMLVSYLAGMLVFFLVGIPERIARLSLMSYVPPYRADIATGLASICLCVYVLAIAKDLNKQAGTWHKIMPWVVSAAVSLMFGYHGWVLMKATEGFPPVSFMLAVALIAGFFSYWLLAGKTMSFCVAMSAILVATSSFFNPLATNLDHIYDSELGQQIVKLNNEATDHPLWICYGGVHPGVLVSTLGGRSLTGIQWPPQLSLWRRLDGSDGAYENIYNRYALVQLTYRPDAAWVSFSSSQDDAFEVRVCPDHPVLKKMGARFVLAMGDTQEVVAQSKLDLIYTSTNGSFSIFEIPRKKN